MLTVGDKTEHKINQCSVPGGWAWALMRIVRGKVYRANNEGNNDMEQGLYCGWAGAVMLRKSFISFILRCRPFSLRTDRHLFTELLSKIKNSRLYVGYIEYNGALTELLN